MALFDDDIEWVQPGDSAVSGTYRGQKELSEFVTALAAKAPMIAPHASWPTATRWWFSARPRSVENAGHSAEVYTIGNGKTLRVQVYGDTAMMERQYGRKNVAAL
ncbi:MULTISPECIES: DUF4440 domain-containing protein [Mycolicibacter]|uniref:nuclear transport factor 2 family protein n=1 Tax=Mycolicibacter TaxID=1073531 RepID=UPI000A96DD91